MDKFLENSGDWQRIATGQSSLIFVYKQSLVGRQPCSFIYALTMDALCYTSIVVAEPV